MFNNLTPTVKSLLLITIGSFLVVSFILPELQAILALYYIQSPRFIPTQYISYMFMHADGWHLFSNMLGLFVFGPLLEQSLGPKRLLTLWMVCGVGSGLLYSGYTSFKVHRMDQKIEAFTADPDPDRLVAFVRDYPHLYRSTVYDFIDDYERATGEERKNLERQAVRDMQGARNNQVNVPMVGASGALFGILIAFAMLFPNLQLFLLIPPMPVRAKYLVLFYSLYTVYNLLNRNPYDNVAHFAHLAGLLIGAVMIIYWKRNSGIRY
ncbi:rhomboid family protein [Nitritalea halalkaliphila LW7]|uniref:Rhomboid family protein n=1 Tax=Nitritalea halalkaliphila LW7 TaxID=1189621 RepID=I5C2B0_9BACT|nr:rhomboid family intramembrane serine protease [Nitritalea halalkaliphila]EIM75962.1 rhomboid family protein [Nitritalea halalkaliphila LW7]